MIKSLCIFLLSAFCEVGGGYLVWLWLKEEKHALVGLIGFVLLSAYGVVATWQIEGFGRVYAAYGGVFIAFSLVWAMKFDGFIPDKWDILGSIIALVGVGLIMFAPRN